MVEWLPQIVILVMSLTLTPSRCASCVLARLWSRRVIAVKRPGSRSASSLRACEVGQGEATARLRRGSEKDYKRARVLYESIKTNPSLSPAMRYAVINNLGVLEALLHRGPLAEHAPVVAPVVHAVGAVRVLQVFAIQAHASAPRAAMSAALWSMQ